MKDTKHYILPAVFAGGVLAAAVAGHASTSNELHVEVTGLKSDRGDVIFNLYNSAQTFTKQAYKTAIVNIEKDKCEWVLKNLPSGDYAIVLVHDENGNHDMDKDFLGIPEEPYAFSNNVKAHHSAPPFDDAKFSVGDGETMVQIQLE